VLTGAPILVAIGIAVGNSLEAFFGAYALRRIPGFRLSLDRVRDAIGLIILAAALAPLIAATVGVTSLQLGGLVPSGAFASTWRAWWLGDAIGAVLVAPLVLVWATKPPAIPPAYQLLEAGALTLAVVTAGLLLFVVPARRRRQSHGSMQDSIDVGDEIITAGGLHGFVREIGEETLKIEIAPDVVAVLDRRAVAAVAREVDVEVEPEEEVEVDPNEAPEPPPQPG